MIKNKKVPEIEGVRISKVHSQSDNRGIFIKFHPLAELEKPLDSVALSFNPNLGTVRGLHFQVEPFAEEKLVACVQGSIYDVIVDLRPGSKTFGKWTSFELSAENMLQAYLPRGLAHGFQTLRPNSVVHYSLSSNYSPSYSYAIDPFGDLDIDWPLETFAVSEKDSHGITVAVASEKYERSLSS